VLARYGGEEFALALPGCLAVEAENLLERLRAAMPHGETCSAGLAWWDGQESAQALFGRADSALYLAKARGRDRVVASPQLAPQGDGGASPQLAPEGHGVASAQAAPEMPG
jgi:diguanylate cyclase (GGDEF)-like protein